jgi:hypothetical protein
LPDIDRDEVLVVKYVDTDLVSEVGLQITMDVALEVSAISLTPGSGIDVLTVPKMAKVPN